MPNPMREWREVWTGLVRRISGCKQPVRTIAERAGVAPSTVSRVLRGVAGVSDEMMLHVLQHADATDEQLREARVLLGVQ